MPECTLCTGGPLRLQGLMRKPDLNGHEFIWRSVTRRDARLECVDERGRGVRVRLCNVAHPVSEVDIASLLQCAFPGFDAGRSEWSMRSADGTDMSPSDPLPASASASAGWTLDSAAETLSFVAWECEEREAPTPTRMFSVERSGSAWFLKAVVVCEDEAQWVGCGADCVVRWAADRAEGDFEFRSDESDGDDDLFEDAGSTEGAEDSDSSATLVGDPAVPIG